MNRKNFAGVLALAAVSALGVAAAADLPRSPAPKDVELYIISPVDGETVSNPVTVRFGLRGMGIAPAGVAMEHTGHHHLLIDSAPPPFDMPVPADAKHLHFGKGQTEAQVTVAPGKHTLQLLLADHLHIPHDPPVLSQAITITVR
jgi:hypothetical protein